MIQSAQKDAPLSDISNLSDTSNLSDISDAPVQELERRAELLRGMAADATDSPSEYLSDTEVPEGGE